MKDDDDDQHSILSPLCARDDSPLGPPIAALFDGASRASGPTTTDSAAACPSIIVNRRAARHRRHRRRRRIGTMSHNMRARPHDLPVDAPRRRPSTVVVVAVFCLAWRALTQSPHCVRAFARAASRRVDGWMAGETTDGCASGGQRRRSSVGRSQRRPTTTTHDDDGDPARRRARRGGGGREGAQLPPDRLRGDDNDRRDF